MSPTLRQRPKELPTESYYMFRAGKSPKSFATIRLYTAVGALDCNPVEGNLPFLLGRRFLQKKRAIMNFARNQVAFQEEGEKIVVEGSSHLVPLSGRRLRGQRNGVLVSTAVRLGMGMPRSTVAIEPERETLAGNVKLGDLRHCDT